MLGLRGQQEVAEVKGDTERQTERAGLKLFLLLLALEFSVEYHTVNKR